MRSTARRARGGARWNRRSVSLQRGMSRGDGRQGFDVAAGPRSRAPFLSPSGGPLQEQLGQIDWQLVFRQRAPYAVGLIRARLRRLHEVQDYLRMDRLPFRV